MTLNIVNKRFLSSILCIIMKTRSQSANSKKSTTRQPRTRRQPAAGVRKSVRVMARTLSRMNIRSNETPGVISLARLSMIIKHKQMSYRCYH